MTLFRVQCRYPLFLDDFYPECCFFKLINRKKYKGSDLDKSSLGLFNCYWKHEKNWKIAIQEKCIIQESKIECVWRLNNWTSTFSIFHVAHKILHFAIVRLFDRSFASIRFDVTKILRFSFFLVPGKHSTKHMVSW